MAYLQMRKSLLFVVLFALLFFFHGCRQAGNEDKSKEDVLRMALEFYLLYEVNEENKTFNEFILKCEDWGKRQNYFSGKIDIYLIKGQKDGLTSLLATNGSNNGTRNVSVVSFAKYDSKVETGGDFVKLICTFQK